MGGMTREEMRQVVRGREWRGGGEMNTEGNG